jgi:FixJ family two-component response regulator
MIGGAAATFQIEAEPLLPGEAFARLCGLTGGELHVLRALAQGLGGEEAADMLGISERRRRSGSHRSLLTIRERNHRFR